MDKFIHWLQSRLNTHGELVAEDGILGPQTRHALINFQRNKQLNLTGVADSDTIRELRREGNAAVPVEDMPPWLSEMTRRMGLHEKRNNKTLVEWLRDGAFLGDPARLPWCGDAIETCFARTLEAEPLPSNPFWAQAWTSFGYAVDKYQVGAVGVIRWSARSGHVGFVIDARHDQVKLRGGNQSNMIKDAWFPASKFIAFRWPKGYPRRNYPPITGSASKGGSTR